MKLFRREPIAPPRLRIASRVVDKIVHNALSYETETGESLVGFAIKSENVIEPEMVVLDTIAPDTSAIREGTYFEQGDDIQGDILAWWNDNWEVYRATNRGTSGFIWDVPLSNVGDWHKHPGKLTEPSWGDAGTARQHIHDKVSGEPQLLVILATVWNRDQAMAPDPAAPVDAPLPLKVPIDDDTVVRIDCWYMSRHTRGFIQLTPTVSPDLPALFPIAWHLRDPERASREVSALSAEGYTVSVEQFDTDGKAPLEICLMLGRRNSARAILIATDSDFPKTRPRVHLAPMSAIRDIPQNGNLFAGLWKASTAVPDADYPDWTPDSRLVDFVKAIEAKNVSEAKA
jgi:hypothetical protein